MLTAPPDTPIVRLLLWLVDTPGLGGLAVAGIATTCLASFALALRWITRGGRADDLMGTHSDTTTYAYPTPALLDHK